MRFVPLALIFVFSAHAQASVRNPSFRLAQIEEIKGDGLPNSSGDVVFEIVYWIQPCAESLVGPTEINVPPYASAVSNKAVGIVVRNKGLQCRGPIVQRTETLTFGAPQSVGGVRLSPIEASAQE